MEAQDFFNILKLAKLLLLHLFYNYKIYQLKSPKSKSSKISVLQKPTVDTQKQNVHHNLRTWTKEVQLFQEPSLIVRKQR